MHYRVLAWILVISISMGSNAQSRYRFHTLNMEQGLTSDAVYSICKDKLGYVWMATQNGLNRFDGHHITKYFHDNKDSNSIGGNVIYWIHKDVRGGLWFSLGPNGVATYNYAKNNFDRFLPFDSLRHQKKYRSKMWRFGNDQQGRVYFANGSSCFRYTLHTKTFEDLTPLFKGKLEGHDIGMFVMHGKDTLWITTNNGLFRFQMGKNRIDHFPFDADKYGFGDANMHDAEFINDHQLLVTVSRTGFVFFDIHTHTFSGPPAPINPERSHLFSETGGVLKDAQGRIWLANSRYGLLEYFPQTNRVYSLKNESSYPYPYTEQEGYGLSVYEDDEGNIWYGSSSRGVIWFKPQLDFLQSFQRDFSKPQSLPSNYVSYFLPIGNRVLVGTANGITEFNRETGSFKNFPVSLNRREVYPYSDIRCMVRSHDSVFITTGFGLSIYKTTTGKFSRFIDEDPSFDTTFRYGQWLLHYLQGRLLISGQRLANFNLHTRQYTYTNSLQQDSFYRLTDVNASLFDTSRNLLWLEAGVSELYSYDLSTKQLKQHRFTTDSLLMMDAIRIDEKGDLWLGTYNGLYWYSPGTGKGHRIPLNTQTKAVHNVAIGDERYIWVATLTEVIRYDRLNKTTKTLPGHYLFPNSQISKRAFMLDEENKLWVGTNKGFVVIDTKKFNAVHAANHPELVSFSVFDKSRVFEKPLPELDKIKLDYNENFFSFSLSAFNYQSTVIYNYMLDGFDKDWQEAKGNSGSYTNVPPGTYKLKIRSKTESGGWIEKSSPVTIYIAPPFWRTAWFISLLAIALISLGVIAWRFWQNRINKKRIDDTINYFANTSYDNYTITEICSDIARNCTSYLGLQSCVVHLLDDENNVILPKAVNDKEINGEWNGSQINGEKTMKDLVAINGKAMVVKNSGKEAISQKYDRKGAALGVPIIHEGKVIGVIDSEHESKNYFTPEHVKAMTAIAGISANKIAEARAEEAAKNSGIKLLEIQKQLAETQLMALRAQMNPHFVFNCLNSIQECIVTEKYGEASMYLNKFSRLFRSVLNNSGKSMISLSDEIEVLELYLGLEYMRFEESFVYKIGIDPELETDEILIPSMLLQPFVENALWHGLMHKESDRRLKIEFKRLTDDIFQCTVEDNGIGRAKALELKEIQGKTKRHVSKGVRICEDRIELLQKQGHHAQLEIVDIYDAQGKPGGTRVVIELSSYLT